LILVLFVINIIILFNATMPSVKSNKEIASHLFQKYTSIRKEFKYEPLIETDLQIVTDKTFVYIQLLSKCDLHHNSLYKLLNVFRYDPNYCFSEILTNPYKFVILPENVMNFEKAKDIADKFSLCDLDQNLVYKAWIFDFVLFKNNQFYIDKFYLTQKFLQYFPDADIQEVLENVCMKVEFNKKTLYTVPELYDIEVNMGDDLLDIFYDKQSTQTDLDIFISTYETEHAITFTKKQNKAIINAIRNKLSVICGLPGTGKSTIADCICSYYKNDFICLAAPTGMAVNNIRNKCSIQKSLIGTIHKLLFDGFIELKSDYPKLMIVDEFSMVDNILFHKLIKWCKVFDCKLVLLADDQQLPPISGGYPLASILQSNLFKVTYLKTIKRQEKGNLKNVILKLNKGETILNTDFDKESIFFYNYSEANIKKLITKFHLTPTNCQFISPQHKHPEGTVNTNKMLQSVFSTNKTPFFSKKFTKNNNVIKEDDIVVRVVNNYTETDLYANGDVARITRNPIDSCIDVDYIHTNLKQQITIDELYEDFNLAYCLTVHKVQGSQYENIVLIIGENHEFSWSNSDAKKLLYTAISRAQKRCFILGNGNMFSYAQSQKGKIKPTKFLSIFKNYNF
jgi:exodeoxyribonuclease V alpha subunit